MEKIKVAIVEDEEVVRSGLTAIISMNELFEVSCSCASAEEALPLLTNDPPDIVIMDVHLPGMNGIECIRQVRLSDIETQFIMFTIYENSETVFQALEAGATGYLLKNTSPVRILEALQEIHAGGSPMNAEIARKLVNRFQKVQVDMQAYHLTQKEREILELLSKGYLYKEIAAELSNSVNTIKQHIRNIYEKLHVQNKAEAINKAFLK